MSSSRERRTIIVDTTPEMANWMHPQTTERSKLIQERLESTKKRYLQQKEKRMKNNVRITSKAISLRSVNMHAQSMDKEVKLSKAAKMQAYKSIKRVKNNKYQSILAERKKS